MLQLNLLLDTEQDKVHSVRKSSSNLLAIQYSKKKVVLFCLLSIFHLKCLTRKWDYIKKKFPGTVSLRLHSKAQCKILDMQVIMIEKPKFPLLNLYSIISNKSMWKNIFKRFYWLSSTFFSDDIMLFFTSNLTSLNSYF